MMLNINDFKKLKEQTIPIVNKIIEIIGAMVHTVSEKYKWEALPPFQILCIGYLLSSKDNLEASLRLFESDHSQQIHYINRNTFEMLVTLFYIDDDSQNREEMSSRYFEYFQSVVITKMQRQLKYSGKARKETPPRFNKRLSDFVIKYKNMEKYNDKSWSGLTMFEMIDSLTDKEMKEAILFYYRFGVSMHNQLMHPTFTNILRTSNLFCTGEIDAMDILQIGTSVNMTNLIIHKFLSQFKEDNPAMDTLHGEICKKKKEFDTVFLSYCNHTV